MAPGYLQASVAILALAVSVLGGMFIFLWSVINKVREDMDRNVGELRNAQQAFQSQVAVHEIRANEYRTRMEVRVAELPTRQEMKDETREIHETIKSMESRVASSREEMRSDLRNMEGRILAVLRPNQRATDRG